MSNFLESISTPHNLASDDEYVFSMSIKATIALGSSRWICAIPSNARAVLPLCSGPSIECRRPSAHPPTPRAWSSESSPVEITGILRSDSTVGIASSPNSLTTILLIAAMSTTGREDGGAFAPPFLSAAGLALRGMYHGPHSVVTLVNQGNEF